MLLFDIISKSVSLVAPIIICVLWPAGVKTLLFFFFTKLMISVTFEVFLSGASKVNPFSVGSSILALNLSTNSPNFWIKYSLAPGIAFAWMYPLKWYLFRNKEMCIRDSFYIRAVFQPFIFTKKGPCCQEERCV